MYSFFLLRHSRAASRFFISLTSRLRAASSIGVDPEPPEVAAAPLATEMIWGEAAPATVPGMNTVCPFCVVAAYCTTPVDEPLGLELAPPTVIVCRPPAAASA